MNGSTNLKESDSQPLYLCPVEIHKLAAESLLEGYKECETVLHGYGCPKGYGSFFSGWMVYRTPERIHQALCMYSSKIPHTNNILSAYLPIKGRLVDSGGIQETSFSSQTKRSRTPLRTMAILFRPTLFSLLLCGLHISSRGMCNGYVFIPYFANNSLHLSVIFQCLESMIWTAVGVLCTATQRLSGMSLGRSVKAGPLVSFPLMVKDRLP